MTFANTLSDRLKIDFIVKFLQVIASINVSVFVKTENVRVKCNDNVISRAVSFNKDLAFLLPKAYIISHNGLKHVDVNWAKYILALLQPSFPRLKLCICN